ncbi:hypothetical protein QO231_10485 [Sedimentitalea todarodis]|uniref:Uncharacterized protein n=1 Tax=Sedimentitalea todarodis TaxID=1631240 RepID=A0ABU3VDM9_9RHOB|nr:hypothetical protein [Sedimentitalea todarodis]
MDDVVRQPLPVGVSVDEALLTGSKVFSPLTRQPAIELSDRGPFLEPIDIRDQHGS